MSKAKIKKIVKGLQKASKTHAKQAKTLKSIKMAKGGATKKDACYYKVKRNSKVWPSAYASGRLVQCRKVGAANYGNKSKQKKSKGGPVMKGQGIVMPDRLR
tara:strand:+ start:58 stop:363 length:306 start_codon:yes stop_codon:yes gene_type:complete